MPAPPEMPVKMPSFLASSCAAAIASSPVTLITWRSARAAAWHGERSRAQPRSAARARTRAVQHCGVPCAAHLVVSACTEPRLQVEWDKIGRPALDRVCAEHAGPVGARQRSAVGHGGGAQRASAVAWACGRTRSSAFGQAHSRGVKAGCVLEGEPSGMRSCSCFEATSAAFAGSERTIFTSGLASLITAPAPDARGEGDRSTARGGVSCWERRLARATFLLRRYRAQLKRTCDHSAKSPEPWAERCRCCASPANVPPVPYPVTQ